MPQMLVPLGLALATFGAIGLTILAGPRLIGSRYARRKLRPTRHDQASRHASAIGGAARQLRCRRPLSLVIATSAAAVAVDGLAFSMLFMSLGLAVPLLGAIVTQVTLLYTYLLPSAPGYLGSLEAGGTLLLTSGLGLPSGTAAGAMVLWHALAAVMVVALGLVAVQQLRRQGPLIGLTPASRKRQNR